MTAIWTVLLNVPYNVPLSHDQSLQVVWIWLSILCPRQEAMVSQTMLSLPWYEQLPTFWTMMVAWLMRVA